MTARLSVRRVHLVFWLLAIAVPLQAADVEAVQKAAIEWARIRGETTRLESDWQWQKQILAATNAVLVDRVHKLEARRDELKAKTSGDMTELGELAAKNADGAAALTAADNSLKATTKQVIDLRRQLPPRLSAALELPYRSLANPQLTTGERMLYLTTILNRCAQFNKSIAYGDEAIALPGESERKLLNVIYWGLGQGYALDRITGNAYVGRPGPNGWTWQPDAAAAKPLSQVIAINQEKADPAFVVLPLVLAHPASVDRGGTP